MELFLKIVNLPLTIFARHFTVGVSQGYEYDSDKIKQKLGALSVTLQKIRTAFSANVFHI